MVASSGTWLVSSPFSISWSRSWVNKKGCLTFSVKTVKTDDSHCALEIDFGWCGVVRVSEDILALLLKLQIIITWNSRGTVGFCQTINFPHKKSKNSVGINPVVLSDGWAG